VVMGEMIEFSDEMETFQGYLAPSSSGKGPGVIVLQEYWGLVGHIKDVVDRFGAAGFTALAPDLYKGKTTGDPDDAATLMQALNISETALILNKAIETLAAHPATATQDRIGIVGFCMGGQLALFAAGSNHLIKACVDFYGIHPKVHPSFESFNGPVLGFFAEHDDYAGPDAVQALDQTLTDLGRAHTFKTYPGAHHAFFNDARPEVYDAAAAKDAWERTISFLHKELKE
jgi:carboxymethylenebutenolidase